MFLSTTPSIDLHGYDRESARIAVKDFITDLCKLKETEGIIIHGIGEGILRKEVHSYLKTDKRVQTFTLSFLNPGMTLITLLQNVDK